MGVATHRSKVGSSPTPVIEIAQLPMRLLFSVIVAAMFGGVSGDWTAAAIWYAVAAVTLTGSSLLHGHSAASGRHVGLSRVSSFAAALVYAGLAPMFWLQGGLLGPIYAVVLLTGGSLNVLVVQHRQLSSLLTSLAPYVLVFLSLPFIARIDHGWAGAAGTAIGVAAFLANGATLWRVWADMVDSEHRSRIELDRRRRDAEAATEAKSAFVAAVSHELRTPISGVLAAASELARGAEDPKQAECAAIVAESGRFMQTLLNDLLDLSKIEAGRMSVEAVPFELEAFGREVTRFWGLEAEKRGIPLHFRGCTQGWYSGDPLRLRQIVNNLLSNALKFTGPEGVRLMLDTAPAPDGRARLTIRVTDTGEGIPPARLARLFAPFDQTDVSIARTHGGTGLGLAISRELARLMGGDLTVVSPLGEGATFTLTITLPHAEAPAAAAAHDAPRAAEPTAQALRVLVVDDHEINRRTLGLLLLPLGADVVTAADGREALEIAARQSFDVVLMDVVMPVLDGREATRRLRADAGPNRETPVVGVTGGDSPAEIAACLAAGMSGWVAKPLSAQALYNAIEAALSDREVAALSA